MSVATANPVAIKLDPEIKERLKRLAGARNRSSHWLMREAIVQFVEREEKRQALRQDAAKAWNDYRATGQHATQKEADVWLAKLEAGVDVEPPECHA